MQVVVEQTLLQVINCGSRVLSDSLEMNPYKNRTTNMVALNLCKTALAALNASHWFGFTVKLLNLPTRGTHLLVPCEES